MSQRWQLHDTKMVINVDCPYRPQWTWFSCGPACLQMLLASAGVKVSHWETIRLLGAFPNGTDMDTFRQVYRRCSGKVLAPITFKGVKRALNRGVPVLAVDSASSPFDHVIVVRGYDEEGFLVRDPAFIVRGKGIPRAKRTKEELIEAAGGEFYAPRSR